MAWFESAVLPARANYKACMDIIRVISRLLDDILNHQPAFCRHDTSSGVEARESNREARELDAPQSNTLSLPFDALDVDLNNETPFFRTSETFLSWLDDLDRDMTAPDFLF